MRHIGALAMAVALLSTFLSPAYAVTMTCEDLFTPKEWEVSDQVRKNDFTTTRDLSDYIHNLHPDFVSSLKKLKSDQHWIDLGAGKAIALIDYLRSFDHILEAPQTTAVAFKLDRWFKPPSYQGKLQVREGAFEAHETPNWKKADVITDVMGVISYTRDLSTTLQKVFDLLNVHGELYLEFAPAVTRVKVDGASYKLQEFLERIEGISVSGKYGILKVVKNREHIVVPELELISYKVAYPSPPSRSFTVIEAENK